MSGAVLPSTRPHASMPSASGFTPTLVPFFPPPGWTTDAPAGYTWEGVPYYRHAPQREWDASLVEGANGTSSVGFVHQLLGNIYISGWVGLGRERESTHAHTHAHVNYVNFADFVIISLAVCTMQ